MTVGVEIFKSYLSEFVNAGLKSWEDLTRAYRQACRDTHPDLGGTHEAFLRVQEEYRQSLRVIEQRQKQTLVGAETREPSDLAILFREAGYPATADVRTNFYYCFDLYYRFSLYDSTVRSTTSLQSRNGRVLKTLLAFGAQYDPKFGERFVDFHEQRVLQFSSTAQAKTWSECKQAFWAGWRYFFRYQAQGHPASKRVSSSYWEEIPTRLQAVGIEDPPLVSMTVWFLYDLDRDPVLFEN